MGYGVNGRKSRKNREGVYSGKSECRKERRGKEVNREKSEYGNECKGEGVNVRRIL
jgi:hypothetical protein